MIPWLSTAPLDPERINIIQHSLLAARSTFSVKGIRVVQNGSLGTRCTFCPHGLRIVQCGPLAAYYIGPFSKAP